MRKNHFCSLVGVSNPSSVKTRPHKMTIEEMFDPVKNVQLCAYGENLIDVIFTY